MRLYKAYACKKRTPAKRTPAKSVHLRKNTPAKNDTCAKRYLYWT